MEPRIDTEAKRLLDEAHWGWDPQLRGFRRKARRKESTAAYKKRQQRSPSPDFISYEDLDRHGLAPQEHDVVTPREREEALSWLRERIRNAEPDVN
jgi:hypothetical protein